MKWKKRGWGEYTKQLEAKNARVAIVISYKLELAKKTKQKNTQKTNNNQKFQRGCYLLLKGTMDQEDTNMNAIDKVITSNWIK